MQFIRNFSSIQTINKLFYIFLICFISTAIASFPPCNPAMGNIFAGRLIQLKEYQKDQYSPVNRILVGSNDFGLQINPFFTPFWKISWPLDVFLGYEFYKADDKIAYETVGQQLIHSYACHYLSSSISLNLLSFLDISFSCGYGAAADNFTHLINGQRYDYINEHIQTYIMPALDFFYGFGNNSTFIKLSFFLRKELIRAWELNAVSAGGFMLIDPTSSQIGVRLAIGSGRTNKKNNQKETVPNTSVSGEMTNSAQINKEKESLEVLKNDVIARNSAQNQAMTIETLPKNTDSVDSIKPTGIKTPLYDTSKTVERVSTGIDSAYNYKECTRTIQSLSENSVKQAPLSVIAESNIYPGKKLAEIDQSVIAEMIDTIIDTFYLKNGNVKKGYFLGFKDDTLFIDVPRPDGSKALKSMQCVSFKQIRLSSGQVIDSNCIVGGLKPQNEVTENLPEQNSAIKSTLSDSPTINAEEAEKKAEEMSTAGQYARKSLMIVPRVVMIGSFVSNPQQEHCRRIIESIQQIINSYSRFDVNEIPTYYYREFDESLGALKKSPKTEKELYSALENSFQKTIAPRVIESIDMVKEERAKHLLNEQQLNSFITDKAKESGISSAELSLVLNSGYVILPMLKRYVYGINTKNGTYTADVTTHNILDSRFCIFWAHHL
jgi:hypothetical protein